MSLLGGAECSTGSNPLSQFTKHVQDDKSLQRDRLAQGPSGFQQGFRSHSDLPSQDDAMREFLHSNGGLPQEPIQPFAMERMHRDLGTYQIAETSPLASSAWAAEFDPAELARMEAAFETPKANGFAPARNVSIEHRKHEVRRSGGVVDHMPRVINRYAIPPLVSQYPRRPREQDATITVKGKGRLVELPDTNWEQHFAEIDAAGQWDLDDEANGAIEKELDKLDESVLTEKLNEQNTSGFDDFASLYRTLDHESFPNFDDIPLNTLGNVWDSVSDVFPEAVRDTKLGNYLFEENNPFLTSNDPFNEGLKILDDGGNLSLASLAFEAAVQQDSDHVAAWSHLGSTQAQNEKESAAIRALEQTLKLDAQNLPALMGLAISYTNEGYDTSAYRTLERWLSIKYPQIISPDSVTPDSELGFTDRQQLHDKVIDLFIRAARLSPQGDAMDPDVQVGLGVLFYGAEDHTKAIDCFEAALASTEEGTANHPTQAHLLWNRLGATMANSGRSEEAIAAYEQALRLNPNFVRARYNLGVSCINIGCFHEAAQHLLGALSMHRVVEQEGIQRVKAVLGENEPKDEWELKVLEMNHSTNLLDTLRRLFSSMGRKDLSQKVHAGMDVESFGKEFGFN